MPTISSRLDRLEQRASPDQRQAQVAADAARFVDRLRDLAAKADPLTADQIVEARARWAEWSARFAAKADDLA